MDTHILIWILDGDKQLSESRKRILSDPVNEVFVSVVSFWEIAIKTSIGKLSVSKPLIDILDEVSESSIIVLGIDPIHTLAVSTLTFHHRDPFDRMIISQAQVEFLDIISSDDTFADYGVNLI